MHGIAKEMVAVQLQEAINTLMEISIGFDLKYHAESGKGKLRREAYWYGYIEADTDDDRIGYLHIEADATELSVLLHGLIREIKQGGPHADERTGYAYLQF